MLGQNAIGSLFQSIFMLQSIVNKYYIGPVAQLVMRCIRIAEISGSNPLRSTLHRFALQGKLLFLVVYSERSEEGP